MTEMDEQLKAYLDWKNLERREGFTIANVMAKFHQFEVAQRQHGARLDGHDARFEAYDARFDVHEERLDRHGAAIVIIKRRLRTSDDDDDMDTGQFSVADVRRELEEAKRRRLESDRAKAEDQTWWKRSVIMWVVGGLGFIAATTITILMTLAIVGASTPKAPPQAAPQGTRP
jgi:hypothetical protein